MFSQKKEKKKKKTNPPQLYVNFIVALQECSEQQ